MTVDVAVVPLVDEGLGNSAYLVDLGDGRALVVDASRDLRAVRAAAEERNLRVAFAADTHLHADFLSGARQLAAGDGATVLASAAGGREFGHTRLSDGDEVDLGGLRLRALGTPGHTDEHLAFVLLDGQRPLGVFTGGSLLVGAAARTDLVDPERTEELARAQYRSVLRLLTLSDEVAVWPTHGAGSFCSAPTGAERTSSIGREKATNPLLRAADEDGFVASLLGSLGSFPPYFLRLAEINRRGPALTDSRQGLLALGPATVSALLGGGAAMVDVRPVGDFAAGHVPGLSPLPCAGPSPPGSAGCCPHSSRSLCCAIPTRIRTKSSGRRRRSATTTSTPNCAAESWTGPRQGCRFRPPGWSNRTASPAIGRSTSDWIRSSSPGTSWARPTSSSAISPNGWTTCQPDRWR